LAQFYRDVLGIPLEDEKHGNTELHYGCEVGDLHFAIHPHENFKDQDPGVGAIKLAFEVGDIEAFVARLKAKGVEPLYPPKNFGIGLITAVRDPDGNLVEFTQLSEKWIGHVKGLRQKGLEQISNWPT
jgi:catechol 2,3-dioxygenase-like lactoylglutathione lyase family enzyme